MPINHKLAEEQWNRYTYCRGMGHLDFIQKAYKCEA